MLQRLTARKLPAAAQPASAEISDDDALIEKFESLIVERRKMDEATSLARNPEDRASDRTIVTRAFAAEYQELADSRPKALEALREELESKITKLRPEVGSARRRIESRNAESRSLVGLALQSRQRAVVAKIAKAAEDLSRAMAEERAVREEFVATTGLPSSRHLPFASPDIGGGFDNWASPLSQWRRQMRAYGYDLK